MFTDLVSVHWSVGDEDLGLFDTLRLIHTRLLLEKEAFVEIRVVHRAAQLLDDLNGVEVGRALQSHDSVNGKT